VTITKTKLIESICRKSELPKQESISTVESLFEIMKKTLESGENLLISGFGKFTVKQKKKRKGRNPHTGNDLILDARRIVLFKCSDKLRKSMNDKRKNE
jgi:integration host factor subunit alpha